ncbi:MAG: TfoX/Sxy family protein [Hyphomicrobiales bacterium]
MSADPDFVGFIEEQLEPLGPLASGRFFGGHALKQDGVQFAMVMGNTLYLRVDGETRPAFKEAGCAPFSYTTKRGQVIVDSYYAAPESLMDDADELVEWARHALAAARRAK